MGDSPTEDHRVQRSGAIRLRSEDEYAVVEIEHRGRWVELIREHFGAGPVCHVIEPSGIRARTDLPSHEDQPPTFASDGLMP